MKIRNLLKKSISKQIQHRLMCALLMLITSQLIFAQALTGKGKIVDSQGAALPGVSVKVQGTSTGTITNTDGNFTVLAPTSKSELVCSFIGMTPQTFTVGNQLSPIITLKEDAAALNEVVVVGYGTVKKSNVVGLISKINADVIENRPVARVEQALQGQMAGVSVRDRKSTRLNS